MFENKKIMIVGMARTGIASAKYLIDQGSHVILNDAKDEDFLADVIEPFKSEKNVEFIFGRVPTKEEIDFIDMMVLSPGVSRELDFVNYALEKGIDCIGEIELAYIASNAKNTDFIGITGTNGKTTTTSIIGEIISSHGVNTYVVGNIGNPVIDVVRNIRDERACLVTELSSFQLESIEKFRPHICTVLNLTPDHLNRHHTMENYARAKMNIFKNQEDEDVCVLNFDDEYTRDMALKCRAKILMFSRRSSRVDIIEYFKTKGYSKSENIQTITLDDVNNIVYTNENISIVIMNSSELSLPGGHNLENAMSAIGVSLSYGVNIETITKVLKTFKAVEHRLEYVDTINGVDYINDSKGTNPDSTIKAVTSYTNPIVLIAGGYDKQSSFDELFEIGKDNIKTVIALGQTAEKIKESAISKGIETIYMVETMKDAVIKAYEISKKGDIVLLSPACASWGMYNNYEERGIDFKNSVASLKKD